MPMVKKDGYGVFRDEDGRWWFKTYKSDDPRHGPFESRTIAMEVLLAHLGFDVAGDVALPSNMKQVPNDRI